MQKKKLACKARRKSCLRNLELKKILSLKLRRAKLFKLGWKSTTLLYVISHNKERSTLKKRNSAFYFRKKKTHIHPRRTSHQHIPLVVERNFGVKGKILISRVFYLAGYWTLPDTRFSSLSLPTRPKEYLILLRRPLRLMNTSKRGFVTYE